MDTRASKKQHIAQPDKPKVTENTKTDAEIIQERTIKMFRSIAALAQVDPFSPRVLSAYKTRDGKQLYLDQVLRDVAKIVNKRYDKDDPERMVLNREWILVYEWMLTTKKQDIDKITEVPEKIVLGKYLLNRDQQQH